MNDNIMLGVELFYGTLIGLTICYLIDTVKIKIMEIKAK